MIKLRPINLIPREVLKKPLLKQLMGLYRKNSYLFILSLAVLCLLFFTAVQLLNVATTNMEATAAKQAMQDAKTKLNKLLAQYQQMEKMKTTLLKEEAQKKQGLEMLLSTSSKDKKFSGLLSFLAQLTPDDLWIDHLVLTGDEAQIMGTTLDNQLISQFINKLDNSKIFKNSRFTSSEKQVVESHILYNFQISTDPIWDKIAVTGVKEEAKAEPKK
jgi:Tfp pilus assembly protein PilN